jgi:membrane-associated protein
MDYFVQTLLPYVLTYKYVAIFVITYLGAILLPLPSGTIVMAAAAFATQGYLNFFLVVLIGIAGNISGDHSGYWLARKFGPGTLRKIGFKKILESSQFHSTYESIHEHPLVTVFFSRFLTAIAPMVNIIAGLSKMNYGRYFTFEALGELTEVVFYASLGWVFGNQWEYINQLFGKFWVIILAGIPLSWLLWKYAMKRLKRK